MMCNCKSRDIKPTDDCPACIHKHLAIALTLLVEAGWGLKIEKLRAAAHLHLAIFHMSSKLEYEQHRKYVKFIAVKTLAGVDAMNELKDYTAYWMMRLEGKDEEFSFPIFEEQKDNDIILRSALKLEIAAELLRYEIGYFDINKSLAIGQLVEAGWMLNRFDQSAFKKCRDIQNSIEEMTLADDSLEKLAEEVWNRYIMLKERQN